MESIEIEGSSIEEAVERACNALNTNQENLHYEIIDEKPNSRKVKIIARKREEVSLEDMSGLAKELCTALEKIVKKIDDSYSVSVFEYPDKLLFNIKGDGSGLLIGKRGQTLDALQHILIKIAQRHPDSQSRKIIVDTEKYREKRIEYLKDLAKNFAQKVRKTGKPISINPMSSFERRIIHISLDSEKDVVTESQGEGRDRKVVIKPANRNKVGQRAK